jgi:hypothetical protein
MISRVSEVVTVVAFSGQQRYYLHQGHAGIFYPDRRQSPSDAHARNVALHGGIEPQSEGNMYR